MAQEPVNLKRFFLVEKINERLTLTNFDLNLLDASEKEVFDSLKPLHGKVFTTKEGHYAQELLGFAVTDSKKPKEEPLLYMHYTEDEEDEQEESLRAKLKNKIKEKKEQRTSKQ